MRSDVSFKSHGVTCRGWLYRPDGKTGRAPAILMSHGFSAVKEQELDPFAARFCAVGFVVLVFDYRFIGSSDGDERGRIIPQEQHDDLRAALGWLSVQEFVDPERIGLWGTSYSGGHALFLAAFDPRVKVVVAQVPAIDLAQSLVAIVGRDAFNMYLGLLVDDHARRNAGEPSGTIPIVAKPGEPSVLATPDSYDWFAGHNPPATWLNRTTLESVARMAEYGPADFIDLIAPKPLLIQAGKDDALIPIAQVREAFARAKEPKRLVEYDAGHFGLYPGAPLHETAASHAADWFATYLKP